MNRSLALLHRNLPAIVLGLLVLVIWQVAVTVVGLRSFLLPAPSEIGDALATHTDELSTSALATMSEAIGGFVIGLFFGLAVAMVTSRWDFLRRAIMPLAIGLGSVPILALGPISNTWFGSTNPLSKMAIVALLVFFPVVINVTRGLSAVDRSTLELLRSYSASEWWVFRHVRVPTALPYLFTALRIAASLAVIGAIVAEYFGGPRYVLGVWIINQAALFQFANAWAAITISCLMGIVAFLLVITVEHLVIPWHVSRRTST